MEKKIPFTVSARMARLIGQENFSNSQGAIIELVKNSYDADADISLVIFADQEKDGNYSKLYIIDNGNGMTEKIIVDKWMKIGTDDKVYDFVSVNGRVKSGAKGIGRFALDRLGKNTCMYTKIKGSNSALRWSVDWENFDNSDSISNVKAEMNDIEEFNIKTYLLDKFNSSPKICEIISKYTFEKGTILEISNLRDRWVENLPSLFNDLEVLNPPAEQPPISLYLIASGEEDSYGKINGAYHDDFDYKVSIKYIANENKDLVIEIIRNELDVQSLKGNFNEAFDLPVLQDNGITLQGFEKIIQNKTIFDLKGFNTVDKDLLNKLGSFEFSFYFIKNRLGNEDDTKKYPYRSFNSKERTEWLKRFGGVKIFRDNFRIRPYGENGDDWLRLGERQAKSPQGGGQRIGAYRIRPNQISGTIKLSRIDNPYLTDKSGREGIIENDTFDLFKNILIECIAIFEIDRNKIMTALSVLYDKKNPKEQVKKKAAEIVEEVRKNKKKHADEGTEKNTNTGNNEEKEEILSEGIEILNEELNEKKEEISLLRSLASTGLIMSSFAHELKNVQNTIRPRYLNLEKSIGIYIDREEIKNIYKYDNPYFLIELMQKDDEKIENWIKYVLTTIKKDKRTQKLLSLKSYLFGLQDSWLNILSNLGIRLDITYPVDDIKIKAFESDLDSIFNNLIANSLKFLAKRTNQDKKISINLSYNDEDIEILFEDNGIGLSQEFINDPNEIFLPFITSDRDSKGNIIGTGLGLYIVKSTLDDYRDSTICVSKVVDGFGVKITFKKNI